MKKNKIQNGNRIILYAITVLLLFFIASCGNFNQSEEADLQQEKLDMKYTIVDECFVTQEEEDYQAVNIHIPVIKEIEPLRMVEYYNELLGKALTDYNNKVIKVGKGDYYYLDYEITTMTNDMISVVFRGESYIKNQTAPTRFIYTYNIDLKTGSTVCMVQNKDIKKTAELLMSGEELELVEPADIQKSQNMQLEEYMQELQGLSKEDWITKLQKADIRITANDDGTFTKEAENPYIYSYIKDGKTILAIKVNHAMGDYVEIKLP